MKVIGWLGAGREGIGRTLKRRGEAVTGPLIGWGGDGKIAQLLPGSAACPSGASEHEISQGFLVLRCRKPWFRLQREKTTKLQRPVQDGPGQGNVPWPS